jgi:hypothetical protein
VAVVLAGPFMAQVQAEIRMFASTAPDRRHCYSATSMDAFRPPGGERDGLTIHDTMGVLDRHLADLVDRKALRPLILALPRPRTDHLGRSDSSRKRHNRKSPNSEACHKGTCRDCSLASWRSCAANCTRPEHQCVAPPAARMRASPSTLGGMSTTARRDGQLEEPHRYGSACRGSNKGEKARRCWQTQRRS